ncbi:hypothetical protein [Variovorax arabinosiphilus]|uniref:hypothetical protein n=1 Tax=Variovorax arabinosiphilus TaxID=3053498 RepID=UPI0025780C8A|nr:MULTISPECIES: hypothetical protein [unclassified Variovorax]MDM0122204.1 hypothetical protein [Variovorax sp. J2L1-78]MDM0131267.1 hypothetical protein [Variovorax sp. J2L1-63]MDM0234967.1 hypothetical protein [Variovorax sp. J2R1-6]
MIDPSTQLAAMIRAQFGAQFSAQAKGQTTRADAALRHTRSATAKPETPRRPHDKTEGRSIEQMVALRVRALSPDDPQRQRKAFRLFLESVLTQAFGRDRLDDQGFDRMVNAVLQRMESDKALEAALREAGDLLLADAAPAKGQSR